MAAPAGEYPLGYSLIEEDRLVSQAARLQAFTEDALRRAGIAPGMQVLDLGSGMGDVSMLVARIVGSGGSVLGVEKAESSVEAARRRTRTIGLTNVSFEEDDLTTFDTGRKFDAIVGRFVLSYVANPAVVLRRLGRRLRPGGIVTFLEMDMSQIAQVPPSDLFEQARTWILAGFAAGGAELAMGSKLYATFQDAGLPAPRLYAAHPVVGGPDCPGYDDLALALRSLLPTIREKKIADIPDSTVETLGERLRADARESLRVLFMSRIVAAAARIN